MQVLRAVAALMVVIGHSQSAVAPIVIARGGSFARSTLVPWGAGVDLFFVISGFIMVHASARLFDRAGARREFLARRLIRIVPLYWLGTSIFLALLAVATLKGGDPFPSVAAILASFAFVPMDSWGDGQMFPVFDLGWTLNYEMFFYALFAVVVAWRRRLALIVLGAVLLACVALGAFVPAGSAIGFWTRPILLDFGFGVLIGAMVAARLTVPRAVRVVLALGATAVLLADPFHVFDGAIGTTVANDWPRVFAAGVPVAFLLAAAVLGSEPRRPRALMPLTHIGDASYSLYLFHPFALILVQKLAQKVPAVAAVPGWALVLATVALAIVIALASFRLIERPIAIALTRRSRSPRRVSRPFLPTA